MSSLSGPSVEPCRHNHEAACSANPEPQLATQHVAINTWVVPTTRLQMAGACQLSPGDINPGAAVLPP
eukprot:7293725-Alexandrium_andersonii.AAC.1